MNAQPNLCADRLDPGALAHALRDTLARALAIVALGAVALIHLLDLPGTFQTQAYKGVLYLLLIGGCVVVAARLLTTSDRRAWWLAFLLPAGAMVAYVVSRTIGIPGGADDIGNWGEPLGIASLFVEGALVTLAGAVLSAVRLPAGAESRSRLAARLEAVM